MSERSHLGLIPALFALGLVVFLPVLAWSGELLIFGNDYSAPKIYQEDGAAKGVLVEILRLVDQELPTHSFEIKLFPWARAYGLAAEGAGGIIGLSMTTERLKIFDYSDVVYYDEVVLVVVKGQEFPFAKMEDLQGKSVGIGRSGSFGEDFEKAKASGLFRVDEDNGPEMRLKKLLAGRIDVALMNPGKAAVDRAMDLDQELKGKRDQVVVLPNPLKRDPNYLGFAKTMQMQGFIQEFNAALKKVQQGAALQKILKGQERK